MRLLLRKPTQALKKSYASQPALKSQVEVFRKALTRLLSRIDEGESAEFQRNIVSSFLSESFYGEQYKIHTLERSDLQINYEQDDTRTSSAVVVVKRVYGAEMMMPLKPNVRALHELILTYFESREQQPDRIIQHLIVTDAYNWFLFEEPTFRRVFYENTKLQRLYQLKQQHRRDNIFFYGETAKVIRDLKIEIPVVYFNLREIGDHGLLDDSTEVITHLIPIYRLFAPEHLLGLEKETEWQRANACLAELLPILGVQEVTLMRHKKNVGYEIKRYPPELRQEDSLLETAIGRLSEQSLATLNGSIIAYLKTTDEPIISLALYYCLTFLLRALGQKLLGARPDGAFNDSAANRIDSLVGLLQPTILTDADAKALNVFLDRYSFIISKAPTLIEDEKPFLTLKDLGLVLDKLSGFGGTNIIIPEQFTTKVIQDVLSQAIIRRFNEVHSCTCSTFEELRESIRNLDTNKANDLINNLKIGDLAVGSGRLILTALNGLITLKAALGILCDEDGYPLHHYSFEVEEGELFVSDTDGGLFDYQSSSNSSRPTEALRVQKTLFREKQTLLSNCFFCIDSNPMALSLYRFRLLMDVLMPINEEKQLALPTLNLALGNSLVKPNETDSKSIVDRLQRLTTDYVLKYQTNQLFDVELSAQQQKDKARRERDIARWENRLREQENEIVYSQAINWATAFPKITDSQGNFLGFDVIICQPEASSPTNWNAFLPYLKRTFPTVFAARSEPYIYFVEEGMRLLQPMGLAAWVLPIDWQVRSYGAKFRKWLTSFPDSSTDTLTKDMLVLILRSNNRNISGE